MIYTIGHKKSYLLYFAEQGLPQKLGRCGDYRGGSVWKTREEAAAHCPEGYDVYGVLADWDTQTTPSEEGDYHDLLVTSLLVKLKKAKHESRGHQRVA